MTNDTLLTELEEDLRQERLHALWKEYGAYIIAGVVLAVLLTGFISGWRSWNEKTGAAQTALIMEALDSNDIPAALDKAAAQLRGGPRAVAWLVEAGALVQTSKEEEALAVYKKAGADGGLPGIYRDLAVLLGVRLEWSLAGADTDAKALMATLKPLLDSPGNPWHFHARIQAALIAAHDMKDYALAQQYIAPVIAADDIPESLRERARALGQIYRIKLSAASVNAPAEKDKPEG